MWTLESNTFPQLLPMRNRSPGVHVSDVIRFLGPYRDLPFSDELAGMRELGCMFEWALITRMMLESPGKYLVPGELCCNGLYLTPDLAECKPIAYADEILEIKFTSETPPEAVPIGTSDLSPQYDKKFHARRTQLKSYCHAMQCPHGRLIIGYIPRRGPFVEYREWAVTFTDIELRTNWRMITSCANSDQFKRWYNEQ